MPRKPSTGPNLSRIAERLELSISTVSRALRHAEGINEETRSRVQRVADELGYSLPKRKGTGSPDGSITVLALTQCSSAGSNQAFLAGLSRAAVSLGISIHSHHVKEEECERILDPKWQPPALANGLVQGIVLIHRWPTEVVAELSKRWPIVSIIHEYPSVATDQIAINDRMGILNILRHFYAGGHRRVGFFGFNPEMSWSLGRFGAYVEALNRLDLVYAPENVIQISLRQALASSVFSPDIWGREVRKRLDRGVDAWVCASAMAAHTLCRFFLDKGLRIPEDVALASHHQGWVDEGALPRLTTTKVQDEELGKAALLSLVYRLQHPQESQRTILFPSVLIPGETTRPITQPLPL